MIRWKVFGRFLRMLRFIFGRREDSIRNLLVGRGCQLLSLSWSSISSFLGGQSTSTDCKGKTTAFILRNDDHHNILPNWTWSWNRALTKEMVQLWQVSSKAPAAYPNHPKTAPDVFFSSPQFPYDTKRPLWTRREEALTKSWHCRWWLPIKGRVPLKFLIIRNKLNQIRADRWNRTYLYIQLQNVRLSVQ